MCEISTVTIPLSEYERLKNTERNLQELAKEERIILDYGWGQSLQVVSKDEAIKKVADLKNQQEKELNEIKSLKLPLFNFGRKTVTELYLKSKGLNF